MNESFFESALGTAALVALVVVLIFLPEALQ